MAHLPPPLAPLSPDKASFSPTHPIERAEFTVEGALWDMDGTLVDSIKAVSSLSLRSSASETELSPPPSSSRSQVEAAWSSVAKELGLDAEEVIAATHGRRAIDNLKDLKPQLRRLSNAEMEPHVEEFEKRILKEADEFGEKVRSRRNSESSSRRGSTSSSRRPSQSGSRRGSGGGPNPLLTGLAGGQFGLSKIEKPSTSTSSGKTSPPAPQKNGNGADLDHVNDKLANFDLTTPDRMAQLDANPFDDDDEDSDADSVFDLDEYTEEEIGCRNKGVRILPGVKRLIETLPSGQWAVATSSAKVYAHGALARAGIKRPKVTITADDPRLTAGKPDPAPFLLAAKDLGIPIEKCVVFEDSPSGIKAGVASGAKTIAICTSHPVEKIAGAGAHYIVPSLECVHIVPSKDKKSFKVIIDAHPPSHPRHGSRGSFVAVPPDWQRLQVQNKAAFANAAAKEEEKRERKKAQAQGGATA
ncbi:hypothetical protein JCM8097_009248 [Rhodosporidiobolus ruineniae]